MSIADIQSEITSAIQQLREAHEAIGSGDRFGALAAVRRSIVRAQFAEGALEDECSAPCTKEAA